MCCNAILANWLGRASHAIVMDADPSAEKWNYPVYGFASSFVKRSANEIEVRTNLLYAKDSPEKEHDKSPRKSDMKQFHYMLEVDNNGKITGGYYYSDSQQIDFFLDSAMSPPVRHRWQRTRQSLFERRQSFGDLEEVGPARCPP